MSALRVRGLRAGYSGSLVVNGIDLEVEPGEIVALLGRNGVGKSTVVSAISGTLPLTGGEIAFGDRDVTGLSSSARFRAGLRSMRQDKPVIGELSVRDNLALVGASVGEASRSFPFLAERARQKAGTLSGGEQKMLAMARQAANPGLLWILDEPTEGLQPANVERCSQLIAEAAASGCAVLLVEQHLAMALATAHRWYLVEKGLVKDAGQVIDSTHSTIARELAL